MHVKCWIYPASEGDEWVRHFGIGSGLCVSCAWIAGLDGEGGGVGEWDGRETSVMHVVMESRGRED
jgi:hypothetical protein